MSVTRTGIVRCGRGERLAARMVEVGWEADRFIGIPDTRGRDWYIVKTNPQCEFRAVESLNRAGFPAYTPVFRSRLYDPKTKKRVQRTRPFIVGYIVVLLERAAPDFGMVRDCDGVKDILPLTGEGAKFRLPNSEVEKMRAAEASYWLEQDLAFNNRRKNWTRGHKVVSSEPMVIARGAFQGFRAAITKMEGEGRAKVIVPAVSGNQNVQTLTVSLDDLEKVA